MPRFFFDLSDGSRDADEVGIELPDDRAARREAIRFLGEVLKHEPDRLADGTLKVDVHSDMSASRWTIAAVIERA